MNSTPPADPSANPGGGLWLQPSGYFAAAVALLVGGVLAWLSFGASADWRIDYGREVYVPWRLTEGDVLLRDIAYFNGPLSPYVNALWFALFGVSIRVQAILNLLIIAGTSIVLWHLTKRLAGRLSALLATVGWLPMLAFQHQGTLGNFNWLAPYSHEMPHGIALSLGAMLCLARYLDRPSPMRLGVCGALAGLCALTKPEITLATGAGIAAGIAGAWWMGSIRPRTESRAWLRDLRGGLIGAALPIATAVLLLMPALGWSDAVRATLGGWRYVFETELRSLKFYQVTMGTYDLSKSLFGITLWSGIWLYTLAVPVALAFAIGPRSEASRPRRIALTLGLCVLPLALHSTLKAHGYGMSLFEASPVILTALALITAYAGWRPGAQAQRAATTACLVAPVLLLLGQATQGAGVLGSLFGSGLIWDYAFRPFPLICLAAAGACGYSAWTWPRLQRRGEEGSPATAVAMHFAFAVFATAMLLKIFFAAKVREYGFGLGVPATMLAIAVLVRWLPDRLARHGANLSVLRATGTGMAILATFGVGIVSYQMRTERTYKVDAAHPGDAMWQRDLVGSQLQQLDRMVNSLGPDETLAVVPEGITFNYRWRRANPTGHVNLMPPEFVMFGEEAIVADFANRPPDAIMVLHRVTTEYGLPLFSKHFGVKLARWIQQNYTAVDQLGHVPFERLESDGVLLMRRNDLLPAKRPK